MDLEDIRPTEEWLAGVYSGIEGTNAFVFVISPESVRSKSCLQELAHAIEHNKRLVPIMRREVDASAFWGSRRDLMLPETNLLPFPIYRPPSDLEEELEEAVFPFGPMVAIGEPGARLPKPGALRDYAGDDEWQEVVSHWLSAASLVILRAGYTEGLWWEVRQAVATVSPDRFLILMIGSNRTVYEAFTGRIRVECGIELPSFEEVQRWRMVAGFFEFEGDWTPHFLPLKAPYWRTNPKKLFRQLCYYTLHPVCLRLGVSWQPPPILIWKGVWVLLSVLFVGLLGLLFLFLTLYFLIDWIISSVLSLVLQGGFSNSY